MKSLFHIWTRWWSLFIRLLEFLILFAYSNVFFICIYRRRLRFYWFIFWSDGGMAGWWGVV